MNPDESDPIPFPSTGEVCPVTERLPATLLDHDELPLARGRLRLPVAPGVGVFWPDCPMPADGQLAHARGFTLASGERLEIDGLKLCPGCPPSYEFHARPG